MPLNELMPMLKNYITVIAILLSLNLTIIGCNRRGVRVNPRDNSITHESTTSSAPPQEEMTDKKSVVASFSLQPPASDSEVARRRKASDLDTTECFCTSLCYCCYACECCRLLAPTMINCFELTRRTCSHAAIECYACTGKTFLCCSEIIRCLKECCCCLLDCCSECCDGGC